MQKNRMPENEVEILRDAFVFLRDHNDPPAPGTAEAETFWLQAAKDLGAAAAKRKDHPLAVGVLLALYSYLEQKGRAKGEGT